MAYFKIDSTDFSNLVSGLKVNTQHLYNSNTNANGDTLVDYINSKRSIEVSFIPLNSTQSSSLFAALNFDMEISFLNPLTNSLETVDCILPENQIEYYTIQVNNIRYQGFTLTFKEL